MRLNQITYKRKTKKKCEWEENNKYMNMNSRSDDEKAGCK